MSDHSRPRNICKSMHRLDRWLWLDQHNNLLSFYKYY